MAMGAAALLLLLQEGEPALTQAELTPRQVVEMLDRYIVGQVRGLCVSLRRAPCVGFV